MPGEAVVADGPLDAGQSIPIRVISLTRSSERRATIDAHLRELGLTFSFFDAVDGRTMDAATLAGLTPAAKTRLDHDFTPGELGVAASFQRLCQQIAEGPDEYVCILEDDARLDRAALPFLRREELARLPPFDVLRLGHGGLRSRHGFVRIGDVAGTEVVAPVMHRSGSFGQIVTPAGARRIAAGMAPLQGPVDWQIYEYSEFPLRILQTRVPVIGPVEFESTTKLAALRLADAEGTPGSTLRRARKLAKARSRAHFREAWGLWLDLRAHTFRR